MKRTTGQHAPRAGRGIAAAVALLASVGLAFMPYGPTPVRAASPIPATTSPVPAESTVPDPSPAPTTSPSGPTPSAPAATPAPATPSPTAVPTPAETPSTDPSGGPAAPSAEESPLPTDPAAPALAAVAAEFTHATVGAPSPTRVDPGSEVTIAVSVRPVAPVANGELRERLPSGWTLADAGGATWDPTTRTLGWSLAGIVAGETIERTFRATAPSLPDEHDRPSRTARFKLDLVADGVVAGGPGLDLVVAGKVVIDGPYFAVAPAGGAPTPPAAWTPTLEGLERHRAFRVRFDLANLDSIETSLVPLLEQRGPGFRWFARVPALEPVAGAPFYVSREWVRADHASTSGTTLGETGEVDGGGYRSTGENPVPETTLAPGVQATIEFTVRATADAVYGTAYDFRLSDAGWFVAGSDLRSVMLADAPRVALSPGQRRGVAGDGAAEAAIAAEPHYPLLPGSSAARLPSGIVATGRTGGFIALLATAYPLVVPTAPVAAAGDGPGLDPIHGPYSLATDTCAACHSTHRATAPVLQVEETQYGTCTACHGPAEPDGATNVVDDYAAAPANDPSTRSYFSHPLEPRGHVIDGDDPLAGTENRHSVCTDCHQPHRAATADGTTGVDPSTGAPTWFTSGRLVGAHGVQVTNGAAGIAPTYRLRVAEPGTPEYEVCLKCHSGYTTQLANDPARPSRDREDLGIVLNPATDSYHPVEAPGTNTTPAMARSLLGTSPYKLWDFATTSVIRCSNCHGGDLGATTPASAAASLQGHASPNRGILLRPYRDRDLKPPLAAYSSGDFALCFLCHAEAPFVDVSGDARDDTNFPYHGLHVSGLAGKGGTGLDIDSPDAGGGNAICAECHFRPHGTAEAPGPDDTTNSRLVAFAPNVGVTDGSRIWTLAADGTSGTCTLTCHGRPHTGFGYDSIDAVAYPVSLTIGAAPPTDEESTVLTFTYTLTNATSAPRAVGAFPVAVTIAGAGATGCTTEPTTLGADDTTTCTTTYTATAADVAAGSIEVLAAASDGTYRTNVARLLVLADGAASSSLSSSEPADLDLGGSIAALLFGQVEPGGAGPSDVPFVAVDLAANAAPAPLRRATVPGAARRRRRRGLAFGT